MKACWNCINCLLQSCGLGFCLFVFVFYCCGGWLVLIEMLTVKRY